MYHSINLEKIDPNIELPADMFIKVSDKFLKFKDKGEELTPNKFGQFLKGGMKLIYFSESDSGTIETWLKKAAKDRVDGVVDKAGSKFKKIAETSEDIKDGLIDAFASDAPTETHFSNLCSTSSTFVSEAVTNPITGQAINALLGNAAGIAVHSLNVANMSIYLAMKLDIKDKKILDSIYLGALMHDFGKIKTKTDILNSYEVNNIGDDHPEAGLVVVKNSEGLDPLVLDIIKNHHEHFDGSGYPLGLAGETLKLETQIVSVANYFDQNLRMTAGTPEDITKVISEINSATMSLFAPKLFPTVTKALKLAFK